ncbi:MAG: ankyrin repeat domain-containing protein [Hyphomicrobiaceae bacterium]
MRERPDRYNRIMRVLRSGDLDELAALKVADPNFADSRDDFLGRHWIINAISVGRPNAVRWFVQNAKEKIFRDEEGYTLLHAALDRCDNDKYTVLQLLIEQGAALNLKGINEWTPLHLAAARDDERAVEMLLAAGADPAIRTGIDGNLTPEEEAEMLGSAGALAAFRRFRGV